MLAGSPVAGPIVQTILVLARFLTYGGSCGNTCESHRSLIVISYSNLLSRLILVFANLELGEDALPEDSFEKLSETAIMCANGCSTKLRFSVDSRLRGNDGRWTRE